MAELYPEAVYTEDLSPDVAGPEIEAVCSEIDEACHGWGTDEDRLINDVGSLTPEMRCKIPVRFQVCSTCMMLYVPWPHRACSLHVP